MWYCFERFIVNEESWCGILRGAGLVDYLCFLDVDLKTYCSVCSSYHVEGTLEALRGVGNQRAVISVLKFVDLEASSLGGRLEAPAVEKVSIQAEADADSICVL